MNLAEYITSKYPNATQQAIKANGAWNSLRAVWRGDRKPSFGVAFKDGRWIWYDFATGQHGDAADFLVHIEGWDKRDAYKMALENKSSFRAETRQRQPVEEEPAVFKPASEPVQRSLRVAQRALRGDRELPTTLQGRGITRAQAVELGLGRIGNDTLIPIYHHGELIAVKKRMADTERGKYQYLEKGSGSPAWHSPNLQQCGEVLVVEGELSAMVCYLAMRKSGLGVIGIAGASCKLHPVDLEAIHGKPVWILADDDLAGRDACIRWVKQTQGTGLSPLGKTDACDIAGYYGLETLKQEIIKRISKARLKHRNSKNEQKVHISRGYTRGQRSIDTGLSTRSTGLKAASAHMANGFDLLLGTKFPIRKYAVRGDVFHLLVVSLIEKRGSVCASEVARILRVGDRRARQILAEMHRLGVIIIDRSHRTNRYTLARGYVAKLKAIYDAACEMLGPTIDKIRKQIALERDNFLAWLSTPNGQYYRRAHSGLAPLPV